MFLKAPKNNPLLSLHLDFYNISENFRFFWKWNVFWSLKCGSKIFLEKSWNWQRFLDFAWDLIYACHMSRIESCQDQIKSEYFLILETTTFNHSGVISDPCQKIYLKTYLFRSMKFHYFFHVFEKKLLNNRVGQWLIPEIEKSCREGSDRTLWKCQG